MDQDFITEELKKRLDKVEWVSSASAVKRMIEELLKTAMEKQGFVLDGPQFDVDARRKADDPDVVVIDIGAKNQEAANFLRWLQVQYPEMFSAPPPVEYIKLTFVLDQKEEVMEKNGNTFVPGDSVTSTRLKTKVASSRLGTVQPETNEGRMKVAWDDGTESWEKPEDLSRG